MIWYCKMYFIQVKTVLIIHYISFDNKKIWYWWDYVSIIFFFLVVFYFFYFTFIHSSLFYFLWYQSNFFILLKLSYQRCLGIPVLSPILHGHYFDSLFLSTLFQLLFSVVFSFREIYSFSWAWCLTCLKFAVCFMIFMYLWWIAAILSVLITLQRSTLSKDFLKSATTVYRGSLYSLTFPIGFIGFSTVCRCSKVLQFSLNPSCFFPRDSSNFCSVLIYLWEFNSVQFHLSLLTHFAIFDIWVLLHGNLQFSFNYFWCSWKLCSDCLLSNQVLAFRK